jgi:LmbE family N-acetylglucosaminyl deacetylase
MRRQLLPRVLGAVSLAALVVGLPIGFNVSPGSRAPAKRETAAPSRRTRRATLSVSATTTQVAACSHTVLNIVAHQDDDIVFLNPSIQQAIDAGDCVRTVYLTAGDAGLGASYWQDREAGSEAAYRQMLAYAGLDSANDTEQQQVLNVTDSSGTTHHLVAVSPTNDPNVTQIYMRLPDGYLTGTGTATYGFGSLTKLWIAGNDATASVGAVAPAGTQVSTVDGANSYTASGLLSTLLSLMRQYQPTVIQTQDNRLIPYHDASGNLTGTLYGAYCAGPGGIPNGPGPFVSLGDCPFQPNETIDHPDHIAGAHFSEWASTQYATAHTVTAYEDDPVADQPTGFDNVPAADSAALGEEKFGAYLVYLIHDPVMISNFSTVGPAYAQWLQRQHVVNVTTVP